MSVEARKQRFKVERRAKYQVPRGTFEVVLQGIRDILPEDIHNTGEGDHFEKVDKDAAEGMTLDQACFQYYLAGKGHITLAKMTVESFGAARSGAMTKDFKEEIIVKIAEFLYEKYPDAYKAMISK